MSWPPLVCQKEGENITELHQNGLSDYPKPGRRNVIRHKNNRYCKILISSGLRGRIFNDNMPVFFKILYFCKKLIRMWNINAKFSILEK